MRLALLTTDTTHHRYFAAALAKRTPLHGIIVERSAVRAPFETRHAFEAERDEYEREALLGGAELPFQDLAATYQVDSINDSGAVSRLEALGPDLTVIFGTGRCGATLLGVTRAVTLNLHGGNPEHYRGLDTHLWAIYHRDFDNLVTTLHEVAPSLDTGDIVMQAQLPIERGLALYQLRAVNTRVCVDLALAAIGALGHAGKLPRRRQLQRGRYYSFMPTQLKAICVERFARYSEGL